MTDLVSRVAEAIKNARALPGTRPVARLSDVDRRAAQAALREVLAVLSEPTKAMLEAGDKWTNHHADCVDEIWKAMLSHSPLKGADDASNR